MTLICFFFRMTQQMNTKVANLINKSVYYLSKHEIYYLLNCIGCLVL